MTREPRPHQSKWWNAPPESKGELPHLSPRDTIRYLNRLKESEEAATPPAHGKASSFWSTSSALNAPQSESKRMGKGEVRDETRVDLRQSGASGGRAACAVPSFRIPDRRKKVSVSFNQLSF